jgi:hypothetical protein
LGVLKLTDYKELDTLDHDQDLLMALAVYDWNFFGDARIFRLKKDYGVTTDNVDIFTYYYTNRSYAIGINHDRYSRQYKAILQAVLYA